MDVGNVKKKVGVVGKLAVWLLKTALEHTEIEVDPVNKKATVKFKSEF